MGGVRFIDMLMAHKIAGIRRFISLEHDDTLWARCHLNQPFSQMEIYEGSAEEYLTQRRLTEAAVVWFDIERMVSKDASDDIVLLSTSLRPGSFVFVTATAEMPSDIGMIKGKDQRLVHLRDRFPALADRIDPVWLSKKEFHRASAFLAMKFLRLGFDGRSDGVFQPLVNMTYKDSSWMATVGGFFGPRALAESVRKKVREQMGFALRGRGLEPFVMEQFNITDSERAIFDKAATAPRRSRRHRNRLAGLGFRETIIDQYKDLMRFIPRYVERAL